MEKIDFNVYDEGTLEKTQSHKKSTVILLHISQLRKEKAGWSIVFVKTHGNVKNIIPITSISLN